MNEKDWLVAGAIIVAGLAALSSVTLYYYPPSRVTTTSTTVQSEVFYFSVANGYPNSTSPFISYNGTTTGIIENVTLSVSCISCYYLGWYNSSSVLQAQSGTVTHNTSQAINGTGTTSFLIERGQAIHWSVSWNITMMTQASVLGTFYFAFSCPNSSIPITSLGPVKAVGSGLPFEAYSTGSFSDISPQG